MRILFLSLWIVLASCTKQVRVEPTNLYLLSSSPVASLVYASSLQEGSIYYETFFFQDEVRGSTILLAINGETNKVKIDHNFDLVRAEYTKQGNTLMVERSGNSLLYYVNGSNTVRYQIPKGRVVVFPEIQLRDFFYSKATHLAYTQLFTGDFRASAMLATKKPITNLETQNGIKEVVPVEITTYNINPDRWAMLFYFDSLGWVLKKEGFISLQAGKVLSERALQRDPYGYLGKRAYSSELVIRHSMGFQP
ncbi:MAG: hypothetical protein ACRCY4_04750 [Brevinema sp.]